jgi:multiple sugar transport system permease protein
LVAYGFARFKFPFKNFWFACVIMIIVIPPQTLSTSLHLHFRYFDIFGIIEALTGQTLNLRGSVLPYYLMSATCMGLKNGLYIYMIRQFFRNVPKELEEAAYVDGCGTLKTFFRIMLPDAKPILTSCFLFAFVWQWTDGFYSRTFLGNTKLLSLQAQMIAERLDSYIKLELSNAAGASIGYTNCIVATGTLMVIAPLITIYLFAQKGFVESLSSTGIKM